MMKRREFLKYGVGGLTALALNGVEVPGIIKKPEAFAAVQSLDLTFTDADKEMVTSLPVAPVTCYHWCFKAVGIPLPSVPGPMIFALPGDTINLRLRNTLDEPHAFAIPGVFDSGPIAPGVVRNFTFTAPQPGSYLYYDNLNEPVNRVMGLHGALIVTRPLRPALGHKFTPYANPTPNIQLLFDELGTTEHFPGLAWEERDVTSTPNTVAFRQWIWILHQADANLFAQVEALPAGQIFDAALFRRRFQPKFFTITGESGYFVHFNRTITPWQRVGEPGVIRILNAGLFTHSLHIHANHVYVLSINGEPQENLHWVDTFTAHPLDRVDWLLPFHRPPDIPNAGGVGLPDRPRLTVAGGRTWPPAEELQVRFATVGARTAAQSPLFYPMHDHTEESQTTDGGNYTQGLLGGMVITGDRTLPGGIVDFEIDARRQV